MTLTKKPVAEFIGSFWLVLCIDGLKLKKVPDKANTH